MRVLALILSTLLATLLVFAAAVVIAVQSSDTDIWFAFATASVALFVMGPLLLGSLTAYWDVETSEDSRRAYRRWMLVIYGFEFLAAVLIVVWAVVTGVPWWTPAIFIGLAALLTWVAPIIGRAVRRHSPDESNPATVEDDPADFGLPRKVLAIVVTFAVTLVIGMVGFILLESAFDDAPSLWVPLLFALQFAFLAAAFAAIIASLSVSRRLRSLAGGDLGRLRRLGKAVGGRKPVSLTPEDQTAASRYASVLPLATGLQFAYIALLYAGLALGQANTLIRSGPEAFPIALLLFLAVVLVVLGGFMVRTIVRARRYSRDHSDAGIVHSPTDR